VTCVRCGRVDVLVGAPCPSCGARADGVAPEELDSLLSVAAEVVVDDAADELPSDLPRLLVEPATIEATTEGIDASGPEPAVAELSPLGGAMGLDETEPVADGAATPSSEPLPRRTPLAATAARWGPRDHPPAVMAPPPPHPLDAPAVARVKRASGTGLPSGLSASGPVVGGAVLPGPSSPDRSSGPVSEGLAAPSTASGPPPSVLPVPERPNHPRVRRWFGRTSDDDAAPASGDAGPSPEDPLGTDAGVGGPFAGAPEGLLEGVVPEPQLEPGVRDPAGLEAAMSRLSAGARRAALAPLAVVAALMEPGEVAEAVVQGEHQTRPAVVVLTDRRLVVANDRRWAPDIRTFGLDARLVVHGWQDDRRATLVFVVDGEGVVVDAISDRPLARDLAQRVRARCGGVPPGLAPPV